MEISIIEIHCTACRFPRKIMQEVMNVVESGVFGDFSSCTWSALKSRSTQLSTHSLAKTDTKPNVSVSLTLHLNGTAFVLVLRCTTPHGVSAEARDAIRKAIYLVGSSVLDTNRLAQLV